MLSFCATSDLIVAGSCFGSPTSTSLRDTEGAQSEGRYHHVMPETLYIRWRSSKKRLRHGNAERHEREQRLFAPQTPPLRGCLMARDATQDSV